MVDLRTARRADAAEVASITDQAFAQDPVTSWTFEHSAARKAVFNTLAQHTYVPGGSDIVPGLGATQWAMIHQGNGRSLIAEAIIGLRLVKLGAWTSIKRSLTIKSLMAAHRPKEPYAYLFTIGVKPEGRGKGIGHHLLEAFIERARADRLPAYLENSNPQNTAFYQGHGFRPVATFSAPGAPPLVGMLRPFRQG